MRSYRTSFHVRVLSGARGGGVGPSRDHEGSTTQSSDTREWLRAYTEDNLDLLKDVVVRGGREAKACALVFLTSSGTEDDLHEAREELESLREKKIRGKAQPRFDGDSEVRAWVRENPGILGEIVAARTREAKAIGLAFLSGGGTTEDIDQVEEALDRIEKERFA